VQWAGRGQLGRTWISEPGNLFAALAWPAEDRDWSCLTPLVAGYLVAEYLAGRGIAAWLKWPNDVLVAASGLDPGGLAKAGGILVEERGGRVLAGLGVVEGPLLLWDRLVNFMRERYEQLQTDTGPRAAVRLIQARLAWLGERVAVAEGAGEPYAARISGLAPDGGLILAPDNGGEKIVYGGQIARLGE